MIRNWQIPFKFSYLLLVAGPLLILLCGTLVGKLAGGAYGKMGFYALGVLMGVVVLACIILLRQNEFAAAIVFAVHLYVDFYLALYVIALVMIVLLLFV